MKMILVRRVSSLFITSIMMVAVGLFLFIGLLNNQYDLTILCILVFGIAITLKAWAKLAGKKIIYRLATDRYRVFPGEKFTFTATVENHKPLPVWLEVEAPVDGPLNAFAEPVPFTGQQTLLWYQRTRFQWQLTTLRRGIYEVGSLRTISGDLLGFFQNESINNERFQVVVYPRIVPLAPFNIPKREFFGIPGGESPVDDPVYILGTSDYHYGRPARYIHWKASARHQRLQKKVFDSSVQEKILFLIDVEGFAKANAEESFEWGLEVIASLAMQFDRRGCAIGLLTNGVVKGSSSSVAISRSSQQVSTVLETLARLRLECRENFIDTIKVAGAVPWGTTCLCLSLDEDTGSRIIVEYLKRWKTPVVMLAAETVSLLRGNSPVVSEIYIPPKGQTFIEEARPT
jgi:uncharacterized protein (DUF58 family)